MDKPRTLLVPNVHVGWCLAVEERALEPSRSVGDVPLGVRRSENINTEATQKLKTCN